MIPNVRRQLLSLSLAFLVLVGVSGPALAQGDRLFLPTDAEAESSLRRLTELGQRGQWDLVVVGLDRLLAEGGAKLIKTPKGYMSVRSEARRRLLALTGRARDAYLLIHGREAQTLFHLGRRSPRPNPFERILAEHPATPEVHPARRLLANRYLERGDPDAALRHLAPLIRELPTASPLRREATRLRVLALIQAGRHGEAESAIEGLPAPEAAFAQVARLRLTSMKRVPAPAPAAPDAMAWTRPVFGFYETEKTGSFPWSRPASDGSTVYVHDGSHAHALDVATGKLRWRTALREDDAFRRPEGLCPLSLGSGVVVCLEPRAVSAIDQNTGRLLWSQGLSELKRAAGVDFDALLADTTAPAVVGQVAVLPLVTRHRDREVHLVALELATGRFAWSVFLASQTGGEPPQPGLLAAAGRVFAATGHGAVASVSAQGEVLWLQRYPSARDARGRRGRGGRFPFPMRRRGQKPGEEEGLQLSLNRPQSTLARVGETVWLAAADGDGFYALDLHSGERKAHHKAQKARVIATHDKGIVGRTATSVLLIDRAGTNKLLDLDANKPAYLTVAHTREGNAAPQTILYVARGSELAQVSVPKGETKTLELPKAAGQLVVSGGRLISSRADGIDAYGAAPAPGPRFESGAAALAKLGDRGFGVREAASVALLVTETRVARPQLIAATRDEDAEVALRAAMVLSELDRAERLLRWSGLVKATWKEAVPDLLNRLTHVNPGVRHDALTALGKVSDPEVLTLMADLMNDSDSRVAFYAATVLLQRDDRRGIKLLARALKGELAVKERRAAAKLFLEHGKAEDAPLVLPGLEDKDALVRALAIESALKLSEGKLLAKVEPLLKDPDPSVRLAVIRALRFAVGQNDRAGRILAAAVVDKDDRIRLEAVKALAATPTPAGTRVLCLALGDSVRETAQVAAAAVNKAMQAKGLTNVERVAMINPIGLEQGARSQEDFNRNYVAQISLRYVDAGGQLSIEAMTRFMSDRLPQIRRYTITGTGYGWGDLLLQTVARTELSSADVAAIGSLTLSERPNDRIQAYQFLAEAGGGQGRGRLLARGLADAHPQIRKDVAAWLAPEAEAKAGLLSDGALAEVLSVATRSQRAEGRQAALDLLKKGGEERVVPGLIRLLGQDVLPPPAWELAGKTLERAAEGKVAFDLKGKRADESKKFQIWYHTRGAEPGALASLLARLTSKNPSERFMGAREAVKVPTKRVRAALIESLRSETVGWVLKEKLAALVKITGQTFGFSKKLRGAELKAVADKFIAWHDGKKSR